MEEEFKMIVGVRQVKLKICAYISHFGNITYIFQFVCKCSGTLWGFVIAFMLFNVNGQCFIFRDNHFEDNKRYDHTTLYMLQVLICIFG